MSGCIPTVGPGRIARRPTPAARPTSKSAGQVMGVVRSTRRRIRKQNAEMKERLKQQNKGKDPNTGRASGGDRTGSDKFRGFCIRKGGMHISKCF